jgi:hypothetical protein
MGSNKVFAFIVAATIIAAFTPIVMAVTEDSVVITFDPEGAIDIDVHPASYAYGDVMAGKWANTTATYFTLYNNGSIAMDTQVKSNASTDSNDMYLYTPGAAGEAPLDNYSLITNGLGVDGYMATAYGTDNDSGLASMDSKTFGINLRIGVNLSVNHSDQTTTIFFQGSEDN